MTNINTSLTNQTKKPRFSIALQSDVYQKMIKDTLGDKKRVMNFIASISSAVAVNPKLQECDAQTILSASLVGESLGLSPSPSLGHFYLVPYNDNKNDRKVATFQLGYVGMITLAMRSGMYKKMNAMEVRQGELKKFNRFTEEIEVEPVFDESIRDGLPIIGYVAYFEMLNGFTKTIYWTAEEMEKHAKRYSMAYRNGWDSLWRTDYLKMAKKTMLRALISKWGVMSADMQEAYRFDQAVVKEDKSVEYIDNDNSDLKDDKDEVQLKED